MQDKSYLEGHQKRVEIYEDHLRNFILPWVDKKQHVGDSQEGKEYQRCFHSFPADEENVDQTAVTERLRLSVSLHAKRPFRVWAPPMEDKT